MDRWAGAVKTTGGELAPHKSCFALIDFEWNGNEWNYQTIENMEGSCTLNDRFENKHHLRRIEATEAVQTLGVFFSMDGIQEKHKETLKKKVDVFADKIFASSLDPNTAIYAYNVCLMKSLEYSLVVSNFSSEEWTKIIHRVKVRSLCKSRISSKFPIDILYGPKQFNGMGFQHPYYSQGIEKIHTVI